MKCLDCGKEFQRLNQGEYEDAGTIEGVNMAVTCNQCIERKGLINDYTTRQEQ